MKTITQTCLLFLFLPFSFLACNTSDGKADNEEEKTSVKKIFTNTDKPDCKNCMNKVSAWNNVRTDQNAVIEIFTRSGNHFRYTPNEEDSVLQIYIGYNDSEKKIDCYAVSFSKSTDLHCTHAPLSATKDSINLKTILHGLNKNPDSIPLETGIKRVNNWMNNEIRNSWLNSTFENNGDSAMFLAFAIPLTDLSYGNEHDFYFALEEIESSPDTYQADLVIVNYSSGIFLNVEDMVHSVPPFGRYPSTKYDRFQILKNLNIR